MNKESVGSPQRGSLTIEHDWKLKFALGGHSVEVRGGDGPMVSIKMAKESNVINVTREEFYDLRQLFISTAIQLESRTLWPPTEITRASR
jgi:hypothetical protein